MRCLLLLAFSFAAIGAEANRCAVCHREQARAAAHNPIQNALLKPEQAQPLQNGVLQFLLGKYRYEIRDRKYKVTDGEQTFEAPILWAFGAGAYGQTYMVERAGTLVETRVSYYPREKGLNVTIGASDQEPKSFEEAIGRPLSPRDMLECFGCHATPTDYSNKIDLAKLTPGVQCERCHGGGEAHIQGARQGKKVAIKSFRGQSAEEISDACGSCHRTWEFVQNSKIRGLQSLRFMPYRLTNSKCYDATDPRISCISCHNVHEPVVTEARYYDAKCTACHSVGQMLSGKPAKTCPQAKQDCVTCHMPKVELPGAFHQFADHHIRKPGGTLPN